MTKQGKCVICGEPTPSPHVEYCELDFLMELRKWHPEIKFLKADKTETQIPEECVYIQGIRLRELPKR
jgi:hypothetical protein